MFIISGNDYEAKSKKLSEIVSRYREQDFETLTFYEDQHEQSEVLQTISTPQLFFETKKICVLHGWEKKEFSKFLAEVSSLETNSVTIVLVVEKALAHIKKLAGEKNLFEYKKVEQRDNRIFGFVELFGKKDKKNLWLQFHTLMGNGFEVRYIVSMMWWQLKNMRLVKVSPTPPSSMKSFQYSKFKKSADNFSEKDLTRLSFEILEMQTNYPGNENLATAFEKWVLNL